MSFAWETTEEDVAHVLRKHVLDRPNITKLALDFAAAHHDRIEKAAHHGDDLDTQADYAHREIEALLREKGLLP